MSHAKKQSCQYIHWIAVRVMFTLYLKIKQHVSTKSLHRQLNKLSFLTTTTTTTRHLQKSVT